MQRIFFHDKNSNKRDLKEVADRINKGENYHLPYRYDLRFGLFDDQ
ncbi:MAG: hypothetical protein IPN86_21965 [Saprospiraceae bacterium]|nr:hypothetical protein [Saprospiraceae bacterium]